MRIKITMLLFVAVLGLAELSANGFRFKPTTVDHFQNIIVKLNKLSSKKQLDRDAIRSACKELAEINHDDYHSCSNPVRVCGLSNTGATLITIKRESAQAVIYKSDRFNFWYTWGVKSSQLKLVQECLDVLKKTPYSN